MEVLKLITAVAEIALIEKAKGNDLFFNYSPHVGFLDCSLHIGGWKGAKIQSKNIYHVGNEFDDQQANKFLSEITDPSTYHIYEN